MSINATAQSALAVLIENLHSSEAKQTIARHLHEEKLISDDAHFGESEMAKEVMRSSQPAKSDEDAFRRAVAGAVVDMDYIYKNRQRKTDRIFLLCMIAVSLFILMLAAGLLIAFMQENAGKMGMLTSAVSLIPGLLGATAFFIYKRENSGLAIIESEITKMKKLEVFFDLVKNIDDRETHNEAYKNLVAQMRV